MRFTLFVVFSCFALSIAQQCNTACAVNDDCTGSVCQNCMFGKCGVGCNGQCTQNSDCRDPNCMYCNGGTCKNAPPDQCGKACTTSANCQASPDCDSCINGKCLSACNQNCTASSDCGSSSCAFCINGNCSPARNMCGNQCSVDSECAGGATCYNCMMGKCASGCAMKCSNNSDCGDPNCKYCANGMCSGSPEYPCNHACTRNIDCNQKSPCNVCQAAVCTAGCGAKCTGASDCHGTCAKCINSLGTNLCAKSNVPCGGTCQITIDCDQSTDCKACIVTTGGSVCGAGCGFACTADSQCKDPNCPKCTAGKCAGK